MSEYSEINIRESIAPGVDKKPIVKENTTIDWNIDTLVKYFEMMRKKKGNGTVISFLPHQKLLPSLKFKIHLINTLPHGTNS